MMGEITTDRYRLVPHYHHITTRQIYRHKKPSSICRLAVPLSEPHYFTPLALFATPTALERKILPRTLPQLQGYLATATLLQGDSGSGLSHIYSR